VRWEGTQDNYFYAWHQKFRGLGKTDKMLAGGLMATTTGLMTVEQYRQLPETGPFYYELHHGELVKVSRPKLKHAVTQDKLRDMLKTYAEPGSFVSVEVAFRPLPEHELWVADVAYVSKERFQQTDREDNFHGAPELVIEVLSPSNTVAEMNERKRICLENGSREFLVADAQLRQIEVSTPDGISKTYHVGQEIPLNVLGGGVLKVDDVFA
jgi:Uma2 family endonuclease